MSAYLSGVSLIISRSFCIFEAGFGRLQDLESAPVVINVREPDFELLLSPPSNDPFVKALQPITWRVGATRSFGLDAVLTVTLPPGMAFDELHPHVMSGNSSVSIPLTPDTTTSDVLPDGTTVLRMSFDAVSHNDTIDMDVASFVSGSVAPGHVFPPVRVELEWDSPPRRRRSFGWVCRTRRITCSCPHTHTCTHTRARASGAGSTILRHRSEVHSAGFQLFWSSTKDDLTFAPAGKVVGRFTPFAWLTCGSRST